MADKQKTETEIDIVLYSVAEGVATITMNRPKYHNAQNGKRITSAVGDEILKIFLDHAQGSLHKRAAYLFIQLFSAVI